MSIHDAFLDLAATAIDFDLDEDERAELDRHLTGCDACRRTAAAFRDDAAAIAGGVPPRLSAARSEAILARALRPPTSSSPVRILAVGGLLAVLGAGLIAAGIELNRRSEESRLAVGPSPSDASVLSPGPTGGPSTSAGPTQPAGTPPPAGSPAPDALPVRGSAQSLGTTTKMAPGRDGDLYVAIPAPDGTVLTRLDSKGKSSQGWPIVIVGASPCGLLQAAEDGSVRVVCQFPGEQAEEGPPPERAFAFDAAGGSLPGWPVEVPCCFTGRVIGDELTLYARQALGSEFEVGQVAGNAWIATVAADGTIRNGAQVPFVNALDTWAVGPDGVAYGIIRHVTETSAASELMAVGPAGVPAGFPVAIDGNASGPSFDAAGRIHLTVGSPVRRPARTLVFDPSGRGVNAGSGELEITATSEWSGAGADFPGTPLVGADGTTFVVDTQSGTTVAGLSPSGRAMAGWPYRSDLALEVTGFCGEGDTGCGQFRAAPAIGPGNIVYLLRAATSTSAGGSIVAIGPDGHLVDGWPVNLTRPGAEFWSVVVSPDTTVYVLAVEPEPGNGHSATILSITAGSHVKWTSTVIEP